MIMPLHMVFVYYKQVHDSMNRESLREAMRTFDTYKKIIKIIQLCNSKTYNRVKLVNKLSTKTFEVKIRLGEMPCHQYYSD